MMNRTDPQFQVTLFERYREQEDQPFAVFVCRLRGRAGGGLPPPVTRAEVHVRLHLGAVRRMLYWVRLERWTCNWLSLETLSGPTGICCRIRAMQDWA